MIVVVELVVVELVVVEFIVMELIRVKPVVKAIMGCYAVVRVMLGVLMGFEG
jgi:hypothetical protein